MSDWQARAIERFDKFTGKGRTTIQGNLEGLMDIHVVSDSRQTGQNKTKKMKQVTHQASTFRRGLVVDR